MKKTLALLCMINLALLTHAQYMRGLINSNYAGHQAVFFNPAYLADNRAKVEINLLSAYVDVNNNFIEVETPYSQLKALRNKLPDRYLDSNGFPIYKKEYSVEKLNGRKKHVYTSTEIAGPSFMFNLKNRSGFAFASRTRTFTHVAGLNEDLLKIFLEDQDTTVLNYDPIGHQKRYLNQRNSQRAFGLGATAFQEFDFSYAAVLYEKKHHFFKGGVTFKYLIGMGGAYARIRDLDYELVGIDSFIIYSADVDMAYIDESYYENPHLRLNDLLGKNKLGNGFGFDFGVVYERRPDYRKFKYRMDRKTHEDRTVNKYKYRIGASISDLGTVNYNRGNYPQAISVNTEELTGWNDFEAPTKSANIDSLLYENFRNNADSVNTFRFALPASLNLNFDYNLNNNWYVGGSYVQSLQRRNVRGTKKQNIIALNARYEKKWYGGSVSLVGGNFYNPIHLGAMLRLGPVYVGTDNLGGFLTPQKTSGVNVFAGVKLAIHYHRIPDGDMDEVSDEKDKCPDVPGSPSAKGCPDEDGDRVPDKDDLCPDQEGSRLTKGCPDEDGDKLVGKDDLCPDKPGSKKDKGCPDSDGDGLADHLDRCPNELGPKSNKGCPLVAKKDSAEKKPPKPVEKDIKPKAEEKTEEIKPDKPTSGKTEFDEIIDKMLFDQYNYYIILGAYINKDYADYLVNVLETKANVQTFIFREVGGSTYYVTFGKADNRAKAVEQVEMLSRPEVNELINGHIWWKKIPK